MAFGDRADRVWYPAKLPPITNHEGLGVRGVTMTAIIVTESDVV